MPRELDYNRSLIDMFNQIRYEWRINPVILGGSSGSGGGTGGSPGGFSGQLPQTRVAGDTTESFNYTSGSISSLLSNLNNLRAWAEPATWFYPHETYPISNTLTVMPGVWNYSSGSLLLWAGGTTPTNTQPSGNPRIDLLTINTAGTLNWTRGTEAASPTRPDPPALTSGSLPIAYVYYRTSGSAIHNWDKGENYIDYDVRPFIGFGMGGSGQASSLLFTIDGGGSVVPTGIIGDLVVDFNCTINSATLLADQIGDVVVDIWKDTYANYPPTNADSITSASPPTLSGEIKSQNTTLSGWTVTISAGDILRFNVDSSATLTRVLVALKVTRT